MYLSKTLYLLIQPNVLTNTINKSVVLDIYIPNEQRAFPYTICWPCKNCSESKNIDEADSVDFLLLPQSLSDQTMLVHPFLWNGKERLLHRLEIISMFERLVTGLD